MCVKIWAVSGRAAQTNENKLVYFTPAPEQHTPTWGGEQQCSRVLPWVGVGVGAAQTAGSPVC